MKKSAKKAKLKGWSLLILILTARRRRLQDKVIYIDIKFYLFGREKHYNKADWTNTRTPFLLIANDRSASDVIFNFHPLFTWYFRSLNWIYNWMYVNRSLTWLGFGLPSIFFSQQSTHWIDCFESHKFYMIKITKSNHPK